ncbi:MAG: energy transducer TonB [Proteobacteria bacterium]|nr:energy transducer TonB [Pseudomonadota bacterium]
MAAYVQDSQFMTRRGAVFVAIILLHIFVIWALATGLAKRAMEMVAPPIEVALAEEQKKDDTPPPPPPPEMERPPVEVPPPDINIDVPVESNSTAIVDTTDKPVRAAPPPPPRVIPGTPISAGRGLPSTDDYYPSSARRLGQEGLVGINLCVGPDGKLSQPPTVSKSSGTASLDEAAIKWAQASSGHWRPATEEGKPVSKCSNLPVRFKLQ